MKTHKHVFVFIFTAFAICQIYGDGDTVIDQPPPSITLVKKGEPLKLICTVKTEGVGPDTKIEWKKEGTTDAFCTYTKGSYIEGSDLCEGSDFTSDGLSLFDITSKNKATETLMGKYTCTWYTDVDETGKGHSTEVVMWDPAQCMSKPVDVVKGQSIMPKCIVYRSPSNKDLEIKWKTGKTEETENVFVNDVECKGDDCGLEKMEETGKKRKVTSIYMTSIQSSLKIECAILEENLCEFDIQIKNVLKKDDSRPKTVLAQVGHVADLECVKEDGTYTSQLSYEGVQWHKTAVKSETIDTSGPQSVCMAFKKGPTFCAERFNISTKEPYSMSIDSVETEDAGTYTCSVEPILTVAPLTPKEDTQDVSERENLVTKLVVWAPEISAESESCQDRSVIADSKVTVTCVVTYKSPVKMELELKDLETDDTDTKTAENGSEGKLAAELNAAVALGDHTFKCTLKAGDGAPVDVCTMTVKAGIIKEIPQDKYVTIHSTPILKCTVDTGESSKENFQSLTWKRKHGEEGEGEELCTGTPESAWCNNTRFQLDDESKHDLQISNVTFDLAGIYTCTPKLKDEKKTNSPEFYEASLSVIGKPVCSINDDAPDVDDGAVLLCSFVYSPGSPKLKPPQFNWYKLDPKEPEPVHRQGNRTVFINGVQMFESYKEIAIEDDSRGPNKFTCKFSEETLKDDCEIEYKTALVKVAGRPPKHLVMSPDLENLRIPCTLARKAEDLYKTVEWFNNDEALCTATNSVPEKTGCEKKDFSLSEDTPYDLIIDKTGYKHGGTFKCRITWKSSYTDKGANVEEYATKTTVLGKTQCLEELTVASGQLKHALGACWVNYTGPHTPSFNVVDAAGYPIKCAKGNMSSTADVKIAAVDCLIPGVKPDKYSFRCRVSVEGSDYKDAGCSVNVSVTEGAANVASSWTHPDHFGLVWITTMFYVLSRIWTG